MVHRRPSAAVAAAATVAVAATTTANHLSSSAPFCEATPSANRPRIPSFGVAGHGRSGLSGWSLPHSPLQSTTLSEEAHCLSSEDTSGSLLSLRGGGDASKARSGNTATDESSTSSQRRRRASNKAKKERASNSREGSRQKQSATGGTNSKTLPIVDEILKEEDYYKILGTTKQDVLKDAATADKLIQKAYRKRAVQTHPDKTGGDRRAFDKVAEAYDVLSDASKRNVYNRYGKRGVDATSNGGATRGSAGMSGMNAEDLFQSFFGGGGGSSPFGAFGQQFQQQRNRSMRYELEVSLEDLYRGKSFPVHLPNSRKDKSVHVDIPRGAFHNQDIVASGVLDSDASQPPGDVHFRVKQQPHATFVRKGHDLAVPIEISLAEAIGGVSRVIQHLDGRKLCIVSAAASDVDGDTPHPAMIATGDVHVLKGEGMPKDTMGTEFGDLYVQFQVAPLKPPTKSKSGASTEVLTEAERHELERLLRKLEGKASKVTDPSKQHWPFSSSAKNAKRLQRASASDFGRSGGGERHSDQSQSSSPFGEFQDQSTGGNQDNQRFYWSSSSSFSGNPFFGPSGPGNSQEDLSQSECRQM